ncbi:MAG: hypothetical protein Q8K82_08540 [Gemmatimonadaceae bacterium]|nr:hypothetical protein [Gemmatimonadaceae bacterium]
MASTTWGGVRSGILPVYRRLPQRLRQRGVDSARSYCSLVVTAVDPDVIVLADPGLGLGVERAGAVTATLDEIERGAVFDGSAGIPMPTVYEALRREQVTAGLGVPIAIAPRPIQRWPLMAQMLFGEVSDQANPYRYEPPPRESFSTAFGPAGDSLTSGTIAHVFLRRDERIVTPLLATTFALRDVSVASPARIFFVFRPDSATDLIELWNLRALGNDVVPVPLAWVDELLDQCREAVRAPAPLGPPAVRMRVELVMVGSSTSVDEAERFARRLRLGSSPTNSIRVAPNSVLGGEDLSLTPLDRRDWSNQRREDDVLIHEGQLRFEALRPSVVASGGHQWPSPSWTITVHLEPTRFDTDLPGTLPSNVGDVTSVLTWPGSNGRVRSNREGFVTLVARTNTRQYWHVPTGTEIARVWLARRLGQPVEISPAGRTALEVLRALGGPIGATSIAHSDLLRLLTKAASRGSIITFTDMQKALGRAHHGDPAAMAAHGRQLSLSGVVQPAVELPCRYCGHGNWFDPEALGMSALCERCRRTFAFPSERPPDRRDWGYRVIGPFALPGRSHGALAVAVALSFFGLGRFGSFGQLSWSVSLETPQLELDFMIWLDELPHIAKSDEPRLLVGEAKTYGQFTARDTARMAEVLDALPEATAVLATLRPELDPRERRLIARLAAGGRRSGPRMRRVIVLTANELTDYGRAPRLIDKWTNDGGSHAEVAARFTSADDHIDDLAAATLALHCRAP